MTHVKFSRKPFEGGFNNFVDDLLSDMPGLFRNGNTVKGYVPVNIKENEKSYSVEVIAPGFDKADLTIVLSAAAIGRHKARRHDAYRVPKRLEPARPLVRARASFHADHA